jgi:hypothetical protein
MAKDVINVKSNGLRNELKEIRKSIDTLTTAMVEMVDIMAQTHKHYKSNNNTSCCNNPKLCKCNKTKDSGV